MATKTHGQNHPSFCFESGTCTSSQSSWKSNLTQHVQHLSWTMSTITLHFGWPWPFLSVHSQISRRRQAWRGSSGSSGKIWQHQNNVFRSSGSNVPFWVKSLRRKIPRPFCCWPEPSRGSCVWDDQGTLHHETWEVWRLRSIEHDENGDLTKLLGWKSNKHPNISQQDEVLQSLFQGANSSGHGILTCEGRTSMWSQHQVPVKRR